MTFFFSSGDRDYAPSFAHTIDAPTEVWMGQDANGVVVALRISSKATQAVVTLKS